MSIRQPSFICLLYPHLSELKTHQDRCRAGLNCDVKQITQVNIQTLIKKISIPATESAAAAFINPEVNCLDDTARIWWLSSNIDSQVVVKMENNPT